MVLIFFEYLVHLDYIDYLGYLVYFLVAEWDGDQPLVFDFINPCYAMEHHAGKAKFKNKFYFQYERPGPCLVCALLVVLMEELPSKGFKY